MRFNAKERKGVRKGTQRISLRALCGNLCVPLRLSFAIVILIVGGTIASAQKRRSTPAAQAPKGSATKYSDFLHSSDKHKALACNACHKVPTEWTAQRAFPDVADFPNHDACVRCHRQQFFTRQSFVGTGPAICTVCHVRAAPREAGRFAFGDPNIAKQPTKAKNERQFTIEFPHDKHQNVIALSGPGSRPDTAVGFMRAAFFQPGSADQKKPEYNNCTICHQRNDGIVLAPLSGVPDTANPSANKFFKTMPHAHDSCFNCHWKNLKPAGEDCAGCHKPAAAYVATLAPKRISAMFSHEGGKGEHVSECTTCHINITRASTLRGLTPDVPIAACVTCHKDNKKTTYPKITTIEEELAQYRKTSSCTYCHQTDVGTKKPPSSHEAAAQ